MLTPEELLLPRLLCIGTQDLHYPGSPFKIGDIIIDALLIKQYAPYGHIFRLLAWWEFRNPEEMPMYVKGADGFTAGQVAVKKIKRYNTIKENIAVFTDGTFGDCNNWKPATEYEFNEFNKNLINNDKGST